MRRFPALERNRGTGLAQKGGRVVVREGIGAALMDVRRDHRRIPDGGRLRHFGGGSLEPTDETGDHSQPRLNVGRGENLFGELVVRRQTVKVIFHHLGLFSEGSVPHFHRNLLAERVTGGGDIEEGLLLFGDALNTLPVLERDAHRPGTAPTPGPEPAPGGFFGRHRGAGRLLLRRDTIKRGVAVGSVRGSPLRGGILGGGRNIGQGNNIACFRGIVGKKSEKLLGHSRGTGELFGIFLSAGRPRDKRKNGADKHRGSPGDGDHLNRRQAEAKG